MAEKRAFEWLKHPGTDRYAVDSPAPFIPGNPQSEAIAGLILKLGIGTRRYMFCSPDTDLSTPQLQKRTARACLLEAGKHFLTAVQYLLVYLHHRQRSQEMSDNQNRNTRSQISPDNVS